MDLVIHPRIVRFAELLLPELRAIPPSDRAAATRRAAATAYDAIELISLAIGLVLVTWLTGYSVETLGPLERFAHVIVNGAIALPLVAIVVAAIQWRRTRRGLREVLAHANGLNVRAES